MGAMTTVGRAGAGSCPLSRDRAMELYFIEHRAKVLDLAAFLDRIDRCPTGGGAGGTADAGGAAGAAESGAAAEDFRITAMRRAIGLLIDGEGDRARRVLELLSDPSTQPIAAAHTKGACGVPRPRVDPEVAVVRREP